MIARIGKVDSFGKGREFSPLNYSQTAARGFTMGALDEEALTGLFR
jgi:hypothetical protein